MEGIKKVGGVGFVGIWEVRGKRWIRSNIKGYKEWWFGYIGEF